MTHQKGTTLALDLPLFNIGLIKWRMYFFLNKQWITS